MYAVRAWGSWSLYGQSPTVPTLWATFDLRGAALEAADSVPYPIVDVRDIGEPGRCPGRPQLPIAQGHRFDVQDTRGARMVSNLPRHHDDARCSDCGAWMNELYVPGTYLWRPADNTLLPSWGERGPQTPEEADM